MKLTGSEIVIECLKEQGVDTVFGYPGGAILNIYDELYKHSSEIHHILTSHEQGASHAADGYARATGKVGVCMATSGPGATNLVTGIATAYMDSVPIVAITANVSVPLLGRDSFQEIDITGVTMPITKHNFIVKDVTELADTIRWAFRIAKEGRPGPVLIDITKDVTAASAEYTPQKPEPTERSTEYIRESDLEEAVKLIKESSRPFIFVGGGAVISDADQELKELADKLHAPVADSLMGKGAYSGASDLYCGMLGMHGTKAANLGVTRCDLLIVVGSRFSDRVVGQARSFAKNAKIIQIDVDPAEINKNILVDCSIIGDVREVLDRLNTRLPEMRHDEWDDEIRALKANYPLKYDHSVLTGPYVVEEIDRQTKGDAIIVTEVGQHQMWAAQYYNFKCPRSFASSGGLGTMGYGFGAGMGAKVGNPDRTVVNIAGDGSFFMNCNELSSLAKHKIPLVELVFENDVLGMVRQWQRLFYGKRFSQTNIERGTDLMKLADAFGVEGVRITKKSEIKPMLEKALKCGKPCLVDVIINKDINVLPMVPAGADVSQPIMNIELD